MISARNDAVCKVVGGENVKNVENAQVREVWELFTKIDGSCPFTDVFDSSCYQFCFWIFLIAAAMGHRYENSAPDTQVCKGILEL